MHNAYQPAIPVLGICAAGSNAGKTTLITKLIPELTARGVRVSVIKHAHHRFDIDHPGKDSYNIREAGAVQTLVASSKRIALMTELSRVAPENEELNLFELISQINPNYADLILVEGFKLADIPKIEVHRSSLNLPLLALTMEKTIAIASDENIECPIPVLDLNNIAEVATFIIHYIKPRVTHV